MSTILGIKTCYCIHSVYFGHQEASSINPKQKMRKKKFAPGPPRGPPSNWPSDPKSDALPLSYEGNGENCKKWRLFKLISRKFCHKIQIGQILSRSLRTFSARSNFAFLLSANFAFFISTEFWFWALKKFIRGRAVIS